MSRILLDSHIFVWLTNESDKVGPRSKEHIAEADEVYVSLASIWELTLKFNKGKFSIRPNILLRAISTSKAVTLRINEKHILATADYRLKDPFDNLLLAQAKTEGAELYTVDKKILNLNLPFVVDARL